jgi:queuosine precursor transporter
MFKSQIYNNFIFIAYILVIVLADFTANNVINLPFGLATTVGTLIFGVIFTLRDLLHSQGVKRVYLAIAIGSIFGLLVNYITGTPTQIILASIIALAIGETADTQAFQNFKSNNWLLRSLFSNSISVPVDSILFNLIAFWATENQGLIGSFILTDLILKYIIAGILALVIFNKKKLIFGRSKLVENKS